jgi:hypothetical protein
MKQRTLNGALVAGIFFLLEMGPPPSAAQTNPQLDNPDIAVNYEPSTRFKTIYERVTKRHVLEQVKQFLAPLQLAPLRQEGKLDDPLVLQMRECSKDDPGGEVNAWYSSGGPSITYCYQFLREGEELAPKTTTEEGLTREDIIDGHFLAVMFHELGHGVIDLFDVPVFGREEDAADQISAFILLQFGPNVARRTILADAYEYRQRAIKYPKPMLEDEHGTDPQRFYNVLCLGYGGFPEAFEDLVNKKLPGTDKTYLPARRRANCKREYDQVLYSFGRTLAPHIDPALVERVKATVACIPPNGRWTIDAKCQ